MGEGPILEPILKTIQWWWRQPDHFDWLVAYLRVRRMAGMTRAVLCAVTCCLAAVPVAMLFATGPPVGRRDVVLSVLSGVLGGGAALLWALRIPTKNQSVAYSISACASVALAVLAQNDPMAALLGCTAFATISGYIALFHTAALMVANLGIVVSLSAAAAVEMAHTHGVVRAVSTFAIVVVVNVAVPWGVQIIVHTLGVDLLKADRDPLTGLYNRKAFNRRTAELVTADRGDAHLIIAMIDLDKFKRLNDTHGHTEGDLALAAVGRALREHAPHGSIIGRAGGEEFLVAVDVADPQPASFGRTLCEAVAALAFPITASVGTASTPLSRLLAGDPQALITKLVASADAAMYEAKRNGGNQTRHHRGASWGRVWSPVTRRWEALADDSSGSPRPEIAPPPANRWRRRDWSASWGQPWPEEAFESPPVHHTGDLKQIDHRDGQEE